VHRQLWHDTSQQDSIKQQLLGFCVCATIYRVKVSVLVAFNLANDVTDYDLTTLETGWFLLLLLLACRLHSDTSRTDAAAAAVATGVTLQWRVRTMVQILVAFCMSTTPEIPNKFIVLEYTSVLCLHPAV